MLHEDIVLKQEVEDDDDAGTEDWNEDDENGIIFSKVILWQPLYIWTKQFISILGTCIFDITTSYFKGCRRIHSQRFWRIWN